MYVSVRRRPFLHVCTCLSLFAFLLFDLFVYILVLIQYLTPLTMACLFHCVLPSRNCCYVKCSHLVVKHSCGFFPLPLCLSTSL